MFGYELFQENPKTIIRSFVTNTGFQHVMLTQDIMPHHKRLSDVKGNSTVIQHAYSVVEQVECIWYSDLNLNPRRFCGKDECFDSNENSYFKDRLEVSFPALSEGFELPQKWGLVVDYDFEAKYVYFAQKINKGYVQDCYKVARMLTSEFILHTNKADELSEEQKGLSDVRYIDATYNTSPCDLLQFDFFLDACEENRDTHHDLCFAFATDKSLFKYESFEIAQGEWTKEEIEETLDTEGMEFDFD